MTEEYEVVAPPEADLLRELARRATTGEAVTLAELAAAADHSLTDLARVIFYMNEDDPRVRRLRSLVADLSALLPAPTRPQAEHNA